MKRTLLIAYDLKQPEADYEGLIGAIKRQGAWWHHLDSTWLVNTELRPTEVRDRLKAYLESGDELLIIDVTGRPRAWHGFSDRGSKWLKDSYVRESTSL